MRDGICQMGEPCRKRLVKDLVRIEGFMVMYKDTNSQKVESTQVSINRCIYKMWYIHIHTMEYCSVLKRKEIVTPTKTPLGIMLSEISQSRKTNTV